MLVSFVFAGHSNLKSRIAPVATRRT
jgi:hypothetical protein